jgi:hypothetical protein
MWMAVMAGTSPSVAGRTVMFCMVNILKKLFKITHSL